MATKKPTTLAISLKGEIVSSNFAEFKAELKKHIASLVYTLKTDADFTTAEANVKQLKETEEALEEAKKKALEQAQEVQELFAQIDDINGDSRTARLKLESQIRARKAARRKEIVIDAVAQVTAIKKGAVILRIEAAIKGKRNFDTMAEAAEAEATLMQDGITAARAIIEAHKADHGSTLLPDPETLEWMDAEALSLELNRRLERQQSEKEKADLKAKIAKQEATAAAEKKAAADKVVADKRMADAKVAQAKQDDAKALRLKDAALAKSVREFESEKTSLARCLDDSGPLFPCGAELIARLISEGVVEDSFNLPAHKVIWMAIAKLHSDGIKVDEIVLLEHLRKSGLEELAGGIETIYAIQSSLPTATKPLTPPAKSAPAVTRPATEPQSEYDKMFGAAEPEEAAPPITAADEMKVYLDTIKVAFTPVKAARVELSYPENIERAKAFATGIAHLWAALTK